MRRLLLALVAACSFAVFVIAPPAQAVITHNPSGNLEYAGWNGSSVTVSGWAFDPDAPSTSEQVVISTNPTSASPMLAVVRTTIPRPDVNAAFHISGYHGWKVSIASGGGVREFCAYAVNLGLGSSRLIGCRMITVPYSPQGHLDSAVINGGTVTMSGWALDRDSSLSAVRIQVFEASATSTTAALLNTTATTYLRADVNQVLHIVGNHGWRTTFTVSGGIHRMCAYALNVGVTAPNTLLGCSTLITRYTWTTGTEQMDPVRGGVATLTCRVEQACVMSDYTGALFRYDGTSWTPTAGPGNGVVLTRIDCLSSSFCMAIDGRNGWRFDGSAWTEYPIPTQDSYGVTAVSCGSPTFCIAPAAVGGTLWVFDGSGFHANPNNAPLRGNVGDTSCFDSGHCVDTQDYVFDGTHVTPPAPGLPVGGVGELSCVSTSFCVGIDGMTVQTFDGTSWQPAQTIDTARLLDVSCTSLTFCLATDAAGGSLIFNGTSWTAAGQVDPSRAVAHIVRCASATFCVATDGYQLVRFDGTTWGPPTLLQDFDGGAPNGVSCASATMCIAIDPSGHAIKYDGTGWGTAQRIAPEGGTLTAVSCPSATWCAAISDTGVLTYDGTSWMAQAGSSALARIPMLTCTSASFCVAWQPQATSVWVYRNSAWSNETLPIRPLSDQNSVSCVSSTFCLAAGGATVARFDGTSWQALPPLGAGVYAGDVICSSVHFCLLGVGNGSFRAYNGSSVSAAVSVGNSGDAAIACPIDGLCVALDNYGYFDEIAGTPLADIFKINAGSLRSAKLSCPSASFCMLVEGHGMAWPLRVPA